MVPSIQNGPRTWPSHRPVQHIAFCWDWVLHSTILWGFTGAQYLSICLLGPCFSTKYFSSVQITCEEKKSGSCKRNHLSASGLFSFCFKVRTVAFFGTSALHFNTFLKMNHILPTDIPKSSDASLRWAFLFLSKKSSTAKTSAGGIFPPGFGFGSPISPQLLNFSITRLNCQWCGTSEGLDTLNSLRKALLTEITHWFQFRILCNNTNSLIWWKWWWLAWHGLSKIFATFWNVVYVDIQMLLQYEENEILLTDFWQI